MKAISHLLIRSRISTASHGASIRLLSQLIASNDTNVHEGKLCTFARKLTPVAGCRIASKISGSGAVRLNLVSARNESSLSSRVETRVVGSGLIDNEVASVPWDTFLSRTLLPDLFRQQKWNQYQMTTITCKATWNML